MVAKRNQISVAEMVQSLSLLHSPTPRRQFPPPRLEQNAVALFVFVQFSVEYSTQRSNQLPMRFLETVDHILRSAEPYALRRHSAQQPARL
jgi:hypothetical protein